MAYILESVDDIAKRNFVGWIEDASTGIIDINSEEFKEFADVLNELDSMFKTESFVEAVDDYSLKKMSSIRKTVNRTIDTTKDLAAAYGNITAAGGDAIHSVWGLISGAIGLIARASAFILRQITRIPNNIIRLAHKIGNIPGDIKRKIRGDIQLYFTAPDISHIYSDSIMYYIELFMSDLRLLTKGQGWTTFCTLRRGLNNDSKTFLGKFERYFENDMAQCRNMAKAYHKLRIVKFTKTTVKIKDEAEQDIYFGNAKIEIKIPNPNLSASGGDKDANAGRTVSVTYFAGLQQIVNDLSRYKTEIEALSKDLDQKNQNSMDNSQFAKLSGRAQKRVRETIQMISEMIVLIGNIIKYVISDINTINGAMKKIAPHAVDYMDNTEVGDKKDDSSQKKNIKDKLKRKLNR